MKIGLIAVSGVRAQNRELVELGLTLPGFIERKEVIASLPSLGLLTLAGMTPPEISVEYLELPDPDGLLSLPEGFDAVALSSFTAKIRDTYRLADRFRAAGVKVILGGLHVSACPDEASAHADAVVLGEGELAWSSVIADLARGTLRRVYDHRHESFDLAQSPMPRFELLDPRRYNRLTVQTQRGCPWNCEFCAASVRLSPRYKVKPIEKVVAEIRRIKEIWPRPFIEFADDNTFVNKAHAKELVRAVAHEDIRWFTESDISLGDDPELLSLLADSGCAQVLIGLETPQSAALTGIEMKADWKRRRQETYMDSIRRIQSHGITVNGCFVLGLDGCEADSFDAVYDFVKESGLYEVQITLMTPFPGTPLHARLLREGRLPDSAAWDHCTLFDVTFNPRSMPRAELEFRFRSLMARLYDPVFIRERRKRFHAERWHGRGGPRKSRTGRSLLSEREGRRAA